MTKKILALVLCVLMLASILASCAPNIKGENATVGPQIYMYLADEIYDFDPINAYTNDSTLKLASLIFEPLFRLDDNGKVTTDGLVKKYEIKEDTKTNEYKMILTLKETCWNDGTVITAADLVTSWKRLLQSSSSAASLLYDVKNARAYKNQDASIDSVGFADIDTDKFEIQFEGKIDYDKFLVNLTSYCLTPIRDDILMKCQDQDNNSEDWAKNFLTIACSGPFVLRESYYTTSKGKNETAGIILERNSFYHRNSRKDQFDDAVNVSRIIVDWSLSDEEIAEQYNEGKICYIGEIPLSIRGDVEATVSDALSTHTYILNTNKEPFNNEKVRQALSLAIDRQAIAEAVVYAKVADAIVPYGVTEGTGTGKKAVDFRENGGSYLAANADVSAAKQLIKSAGITASDYEFSITYVANDDVHKTIAESVAKAWKSLGFKVKLDAVKPKVNDDLRKSTNEVSKDICDDIFKERFTAGDFDVVAIDLTAYSADPFQMIAQFATGFSGQEMDMNKIDPATGNPMYEIPTHICGFNDKAFTEIINAAYYLPYYSTVNAESDYRDFSIYTDEKAFRDDMANVKAIYDKYGVSSSFENYSVAQAKLLHEAEKLLMEKLPVIPIIYNQNAYLKSDNLKKVEFDYYGNTNFIKTTLKGEKSYMETYKLGIYATEAEE